MVTQLSPLDDAVPMLRIKGCGLLFSLGVSFLLPTLSAIAAPGGDLPSTAIARRVQTIPVVSITQLPPEVKATVKLIQQGGPFPYRKDGTVFSNRERRLPTARSGYYREYTVPTPGATNRGARRLVVGGANELYYYTGDHYQSFVKVQL